ncbi:helix-turn-helix domain-containing protein [Christensenella timonensis]|uniref:AraC family transcriptional regulator n=1 Tax=Christensenella timonensis TaxID=1816678 RepID=UPI0008316DF5|nr:AraC family transcriptional regulator [Christensenella timonensis]
MKLRKIEVDHNLREAIYYKDSTFPVDIWTDVYSALVDHTLNCHWHNVFEFGVMLSGALDYYINGSHMKLVKGDCVFVNANTMHMATQCGGCDDAVMFTIVFPPTLFTDNTRNSVYRKYFQPILERSSYGFKLEHNALGQKMIASLQEVYALRDTQYGYELKCLGLLIQVWETLLSYIAEHGGPPAQTGPQNRYEGKAKDILSYIHAHYTENISIDDITKHTGISRSACFRCFRRFTNKKPVEYINEYRLAHAAKMLRETGDSIAEICTACGFSSSSYFGKLFKEKYALTPLQYRHS